MTSTHTNHLRRLWPPERIPSRARRAWHLYAADHYQRTHPGVPWMPKQSIDVLAGLLRPTDSCLEWGAGHSTAWLVRRTAQVVSVEHDQSWFDRVRLEISASGGDPGSVRMVSAQVEGDPAESPYVRVVDEFEDAGLDVCLVDAEHRPACMLASIPKLRSGGLLVLDDSQLFFDRATVVRSSPVVNGNGNGNGGHIAGGALTPEWEEVAAALRDWRVIWCSDGASDAAIWFKP